MELTLIPIAKHTLKSPLPPQPLQILSLILPIDAIAPPTIKPRPAPKKLARKRCRIKRSSKTDGGDAFSDDGGFFDGGDGPFGGGGGGSGGGGGGFGDWEESVPDSVSDPAFDFVYGVLCWIVFSNCVCFAFKKVVRSLLSDVVNEREKVVRLVM